MRDFIVKNFDDLHGKDWYMHIGFTDVPHRQGNLHECYGAALVLVDGKKKCWFGYSFGHSSDWNTITDMTVRPIKKYKLSFDEICEVGSDIVFHIQQFIVQGN